METVSVRALVSLMESTMHKKSWVNKARGYMENNLPGGSNIRQALWGEAVSRDYDGGMQEDMYAAIFHPCMSTIELLSEGGVAWARGDLPNMDSSKLLLVSLGKQIIDIHGPN